MDKKTIYLSLALGIVANMIYGSLIYFSKIPNFLQTILMTILLLILPLFIIFYYRMTRYGISNIWDASTNKFSLINQLKSSNSSMKFLGVSARTIMEPHVESKIVEKLLSNNEFNVKFLVFDRNETEKLKRRAYEETGDQKTSIEWKEIMSSTIQMILRIKKRLGDAGDRLQVRVYKTFPTFRMLIVDDKYILLNHYAKNRFPSEMPFIEMKLSDNNATFSNALKKYFDEMWKEAEEIVNS